MYRKLLFFLLVLSLSSAIQAQNGTELLMQGTAPKNFLNHTVVAKENLYSIGRLYNVNPKELAQYNGMTADQGVAIAQKLKIPLSKTNFTIDNHIAAADEIVVPVYYYVKEHEGLYRIAINNGLTLPRLKELNGLTKDDIATGKRLAVGHLLLKKTPEALARFGNGPAPETPPVVVNKTPEKKEEADKGNMIPPPARDYAKPPVNEEKKNPPPVVNNQPKAPVPPVNENEVPAGEGFFKQEFQKMTSFGRGQQTAAGDAAIFKTASGKTDGKYYALMDGVDPGNIIQITNTANGKTIYAKVLGEMQELRQNHGLTLRISNAAAVALEAVGDKFAVSVKY